MEVEGAAASGEDEAGPVDSGSLGDAGGEPGGAGEAGAPDAAVPASSGATTERTPPHPDGTTGGGASTADAETRHRRQTNQLSSLLTDHARIGYEALPPTRGPGASGSEASGGVTEDHDPLPPGQESEDGAL